MMIDGAAWIALLKILIIDLTLAGDNIVIIATVAAGLPPNQRRAVIRLGMAASLLFLIAFASLAVILLKFTAVILVGGVALLVMAAVTARETYRQRGASRHTEVAVRPPTSLRQAVVQIVIADLAMSLDNVLAVAGAARGQILVMIIGLSLSVAITAFAANLVAGLIDRHRWLAYVGCAIIVWVGATMVMDGLAAMGWRGLPG